MSYGPRINTASDTERDGDELTVDCPRCGRTLLYRLVSGDVDGPADCPHCDAAVDHELGLATELLLEKHP